MRVAFHTFGCKLNQYETEALADPFKSKGYEVVGIRDDAEIYIINTCTVTARADHKARSLVRSLSRERPHSCIVVTGCAAGLEAGSFSALGDNVLVVPQEDKSELLGVTDLLKNGTGDAASAVVRAREREIPDRFRFRARNLSFHARAFLKIQDGCSRHCAYCRVPLARGESVSLPADAALDRAEELAASGFQEIVITGVNICDYRSGGMGLPGLLNGMTARISGARLRLSSLEPDAVSEDLLEAVSHPGICAHFHLCVQSGSDSVLSRMRRRYASSVVEKAAAALRGVKDDPFIAADMIAGFPGETEGDFGESADLVRRADFSALHVFPFSARKGTAAAGLAGQLPERERTNRAARLLELSRELASAYRSRWVGRDVEVLVEKTDPGGAILTGTTANYLKATGRREGKIPGNLRGKRLRARITAAGPGACPCIYFEI